MRRTTNRGWIFFGLALAACSPRSALNSGLVTKPGPDGGFEPYAPPETVDAAAETQVVAPQPGHDAASVETRPVAEAGPVADAGQVAEVMDASTSGCPVRDIPEGMFSVVSAGNGSSCAIRSDGVVKCWGSPGYALSEVPTGSFSRVSVGIAVCGVRSTTGAIACWGPKWTFGGPEPPAGSFKDVGRGEDAACALSADGLMLCWGSPGRASTMPAGQFDSMSEGAYFTCGVVTEDHSAYCWDSRVSDSGQSTAGPFRQVGAGRFFACGLLADGSVKCWPTGITGQSPGPPAAGPFREIAVGEFTACGLKDDGSAECWGSDRSGQNSPPAGARFLHVSVGSGHACGIRLDGTLTCWGDIPNPCAPG